MAKYGMLIDLKKCVGCGACALACKAENSTQDRQDGQTFNWADFHISYSGTFPNMKYQVLPVICNHCDDAPCIEKCLGEPTKALYKNDDGLTLYNEENCIGCRRCQTYCPYSVRNVDNDGVQYSVVSYNDSSHPVHQFYRSKESIIPGCSTNGDELAKLAGKIPPSLNEYENETYKPVRSPDKIEKCIFCNHRLKLGLLPSCVDACPSGARVFGNLSDSNSEISKLLAANPSKRLKNNNGEFLEGSETGTKPNVYYINSFTR